MLKGIVLKSTGSWYSVKSEEGKIYQCRVKGKLRQNIAFSTNPVAVGDEVLLEIEDEHLALILEVLPRKNYIIRKSTNLSRKGHIIASNIDQALLLVTIKKPKTLIGFIDRFLVSAEAFHIPSILLFHKTDQYNEQEKEELSRLIKVYENAGYKCIETSVVSGEGTEELKKIIKNKISLFSGFSGAGKSTLTNFLEPELKLKTAELSVQHETGKHTTTFAEMFPLSLGGYIIDSPGIRGFGLIDMEKQNLSHYFPEMLKVLDNCRFSNCMHVNEPGCAIKKGVKENSISTLRYQSYLSMLNEDQDENFRSDDYA
ncbi:MAG: ribosome small subunit-dependent GTPase A [Flavobacteriales bacterium]|nr:ribosome small subunit-dependent GTPase A [Flavobacteriales bacterium]